MKVALPFVLFVLFLSSCDGPVISFDQPQPANSSNIQKFPMRIRGTYLSNSDSSILTVTDKELIRKYNFKAVIATKDLDTAYMLKDDSLVIEKLTGEKSVVHVAKDSIYYNFISIDTFFSISDWFVLRKMKGYYFLNSKYEEKNWGVEKMVMSKGVLSIFEINSQEDIDKLNEITETPADTVTNHFHYNPTRHEFRKFVKQTGFSNGETFVKISR